jgi:hypothetical protein
MSAIVVGNADLTDDTGGPPAAPTRPDGTAYRFEMLHAGATRRAYADTPGALLNVLVGGYADADDGEQWQSRLLLAARAQVLAQATVNAGEAFGRCTTRQQEILTGSRYEPPVVAAWDCPVPLVLIACYYMPAGLIPPPRAQDGMPPNVLWIDPSDDWSLLGSLHDLGVLAVHETTQE